jgi:hypothetical protein
MPVCQKCAGKFPTWVTIDGRPRNLSNRKRCLSCSPFASGVKPSDVDPQAFARAVARNTTIAGVVREMGYTVHSTAYRTVQREVQRLGLDTKHWVGKSHAKGRPPPSKRSLSEILVEKSTYRGPLKERLLEEGLLKPVCSECGIKDWRGKPLTLQLDHINGVQEDCRIENLRILCPNCHTQTNTWGNKKRG